MATLPTLSDLTTVSQLRPRWQFNEVPAGPVRYFSEVFKGYQLGGRVLLTKGEETELPQTLVIHGAQSDYTTLNGILYPLQARGAASLSFNLSGHNAATNIKIEDTSLANNLQEALRFAGHLGPTFHTVLGHSMGGALALKVAEVYRSSVKKIILFCPALYSDFAYAQPFGKPFRDVISTPFNFLDSSSLRFLREFEGELMLIMGQYDGLNSAEFGGTAGTAAGMVSIKDAQLKECKINSAIPFEVIDALKKHMASTRLREIVLPRCDHAISAWLRTHSSYARHLAWKIAQFINSTPNQAK